MVELVDKDGYVESRDDDTKLQNDEEDVENKLINKDFIKIIDEAFAEADEYCDAYYDECM